MRDLEALAAVIDDDVTEGVLVEVELDSGFVRCSTFRHDIAWSGVTWQGTQRSDGTSVVEVGEVGVATDGRAEAVALTLSAVASSTLALAANEPWQGRPCRLWYAVLGSDGAVAGALPIRAGQLDALASEDSGALATLTVTVEGAALDTVRRPDHFYSNASQRADHPGDRFFEHMERLQEAVLAWPNP